MSTSTFEVIDAESFFTIMLKPQYDEFIENNSSIKNALLATILNYHMYEWMHPREAFSVSNFLRRYPESTELAALFDMARHITNGLKHFAIKPTKTLSQSGFSSAFSNAFARPLVIVSSAGYEISADEFIGKMMNFWESKIEQRA